MNKIIFSRDETDVLVAKIQRYFEDELDQELGSFQAEFLIEFFVKELGPYFYNKGINDAHKVFLEKSEEIGYLFQELEKPTY